MKILRSLLILFLLLGVLALGLWLAGYSYLFKGAWATYLHGEEKPTIGDARFFDLRKIPATSPEEWPISTDYNQKDLSDTLRNLLGATESVAFMVIKQDSILYEEYWDGYSDTSHSNSFSMAKSITVMLVQKAIEDGYISSWKDKVINYLPQIEGEYREELQLRHLAEMTAGLQWNEDHQNPFGITARAYYSSNVASVMFDEVPVTRRPGSEFEYQSGATQLLGMALAEATGQAVSRYASEKLWSPIGAQETAWWHLDSEDGMELTYCCFNSNIRDFARFGKLLMHHGKWNGEQVLDSAFVAQATQAIAVPFYGRGFWIFHEFPLHTYYMRGLQGQYVIVIPEKDLIICRLGRENIKDQAKYPLDLKLIVEEVAQIF